MRKQAFLLSLQHAVLSDPHPEGGEEGGRRGRRVGGRRVGREEGEEGIVTMP